jgi:hypothetical protein
LQPGATDSSAGDIGSLQCKVDLIFAAVFAALEDSVKEMQHKTTRLLVLIMNPAKNRTLCGSTDHLIPCP